MLALKHRIREDGQHNPLHKRSQRCEGGRGIRVGTQTEKGGKTAADHIAGNNRRQHHHHEVDNQKDSHILFRPHERRKRQPIVILQPKQFPKRQHPQ